MARKTGAKKSTRFVIVGHGSYGLKYGETDETTQAIIDRGTVVLKNSGNIYHYETAPAEGGVSTLAVVGPNDNRNRIGKAAPESGGVEVKWVYECTPEAAAKFAPDMK